MEYKVSCGFIDNLQQTIYNVKLFQFYGIFLKSLTLTCTKVKNTPKPCDDPSHQKTLQGTLHTARWDSDPGITSMLKHKVVVTFPLPQKWSIIVCLELPSGKVTAWQFSKTKVVLTSGENKERFPKIFRKTI